MKYATQHKGFTLVEMIVSLGIFTVVALIAIGAFLKITDANKKSQSLKTAINNLNFALESMSREMRVGANYYCADSIGGGISSITALSSCTKTNSDWLIAFNSSKKSGSIPNQCNLIYAYRYVLSSQTIEKAEQTACTSTIGNSNGNDNFSALISPDVKITNSILKVDISLTTKPKAFLWLKGYVGVRERERTAFELQTSVSQRIGN